MEQDDPMTDGSEGEQETEALIDSDDDNDTAAARLSAMPAGGLGSDPYGEKMLFDTIQQVEEKKSDEQDLFEMIKNSDKKAIDCIEAMK